MVKSQTQGIFSIKYSNLLKFEMNLVNYSCKRINCLKQALKFVRTWITLASFDNVWLQILHAFLIYQFSNTLHSVRWNMILSRLFLLLMKSARYFTLYYFAFIVFHFGSKLRMLQQSINFQHANFILFSLLNGIHKLQQFLTADGAKDEVFLE